MSIEFDIKCDECRNIISEDEDIYCKDCWEDLNEKIRNLKKIIEHLKKKKEIE